MNKVISINIGGLVFNVEENAYARLEAYMNALKAHFKRTEGGDEILADIELRIAEMFTERTKNRKEVVVPEDVEAVIATLGSPEEMDEGAAQTGGENFSGNYSQTNYSAGRRIYRNPDDKVIGGVCSGIANYFGLDPLIPRLLFVVAFLGFGTGLLLYIILWIIIPEAKTPSEKLEMKGERVNVSNIEKTVKENLNDFKGRFNAWGKEAANTNTDGIRNFFVQLGEAFLRAFKPLFSFLLKVVAIFLTIFCAFLLIGIGLSFLGAMGVVDIDYPTIINDVFETRSEMLLGITGLALIVGAPLLALLYHALRVLFNIKHSSRWANGILALAWFAGVALAAYVAVQSASRFKADETITETIELETPNNKVLNLDINRQLLDHKKVRNYTINGKMFVKIDDENDISTVQLDIVKSLNGKTELVKEYTAHGRTNEEAIENASGINYNFLQKDSHIVFDELFQINEGKKWRAHDVKLVLKVPVGQKVYLQHGLERIIYDIKNTTDTWDGDMIGHTWEMTPAGLTCTDCPPSMFKKDEDRVEPMHAMTLLIL